MRCMMVLTVVFCVSTIKVVVRPLKWQCHAIQNSVFTMRSANSILLACIYFLQYYLYSYLTDYTIV